MRKEIEGEERRGILVLFFLGEKEKERTIFERLNREYLFVMGSNIPFFKDFWILFENNSIIGEIWYNESRIDIEIFRNQFLQS